MRFNKAEPEGLDLLSSHVMGGAVQRFLGSTSVGCAFGDQQDLGTSTLAGKEFVITSVPKHKVFTLLNKLRQGGIEVTTLAGVRAKVWASLAQPTAKARPAPAIKTETKPSTRPARMWASITQAPVLDMRAALREDQ